MDAECKIRMTQLRNLLRRRTTPTFFYCIVIVPRVYGEKITSEFETQTRKSLGKLTGSTKIKSNTVYRYTEE